MNDFDMIIIYFKANFIGYIGYSWIVKKPQAENLKKRLLNLKMYKLERKKKADRWYVKEPSTCHRPENKFFFVFSDDFNTIIEKFSFVDLSGIDEKQSWINL